MRWSQKEKGGDEGREEVGDLKTQKERMTKKELAKKEMALTLHKSKIIFQ